MNTQRPATTALAYVIAGFALGIVRVGHWLLQEGGLHIAALFDIFHFCWAGAAAGLIASAGLVTGSLRWWQRWGGLLLFCIAVGSFMLLEDLDGFSRRQEFVAQPVAYWGAVLGFSLLIPVSAFAGLRARNIWTRSLVALAAVGMTFVNDSLAPGDYRGLHFMLAACCLASLGGALAGRECFFTGKFSFRSRQALNLSLCFGLVILGVVVRPSLVTAAELSQNTGAAFSPFLAKITPARAMAAEGLPEGEWFMSRAAAPAVAPSKKRLLGDEPVIILLTVDALRADVIASRKHDKLLPTFALLRDEGIHFSEARAPGTLTKLSMASLFQGTYFSQQYWSPMQDKGGAFSTHEDEGVRFTELLQDKGVRTQNFRSISWLRNRVYLKGFETDKYIEYPKKKSYYTPSRPLFRKLLPAVKAAGKRLNTGTFIFSHLSDPHAPYDLGRVKNGELFQRYLSEIQLVDQHLASLVKLLKKKPFAGRTLLIVSADHGEAFGEHGSWTHGTTLYDEVLRVPLIFWRPDGVAAEVKEPVTWLDLGPTILDAFGVPTPGTFMGQSLLGYLEGQAPELTRPIFAETRLMRAHVTREGLKLIVDTRSGNVELYDTKKDPKETKNLADQEALLKGPFDAMEAFFKAHKNQRDGYQPPFVK